jgi:hypothetical protein
VLSDAALNLWEGIRQDAIEYFKNYKIQWWQGGEEPTDQDVHGAEPLLKYVGTLFPKLRHIFADRVL